MHACCNDTTGISWSERWAVVSLWTYAITCVYSKRLVDWPCQNYFIALRRFHIAETEILISSRNRATYIVHCQREAVDVQAVSHSNVFVLNCFELAACCSSVIYRGLVLLYSTLIGFIPAYEKRVLLEKRIILENIATAAVQIDNVHWFIEPSISLRLGVSHMRAQFRVLAYLDADMV